MCFVTIHFLGSFTLLAYTSTQDPLPLPEKWNDADPHLIDKGKVEQVRLRSFSTNVHKMEVSAGCDFQEGEARDQERLLIERKLRYRPWSRTESANNWVWDITPRRQLDPSTAYESTNMSVTV